MLQGIERYLKQAIVDKNASVSSASLVSALVSWFTVYFFLSYIQVIFNFVAISILFFQFTNQ